MYSQFNGTRVQGTFRTTVLSFPTVLKKRKARLEVLFRPEMVSRLELIPSNPFLTVP